MQTPIAECFWFLNKNQETWLSQTPPTHLPPTNPLSQHPPTPPIPPPTNHPRWLTSELLERKTETDRRTDVGPTDRRTDKAISRPALGSGKNTF